MTTTLRIAEILRGESYRNKKMLHIKADKG